MSDNILVNCAINSIESGNYDLPACKAIKEYIDHLEATNAKYSALVAICKKENIERVKFLTEFLQIGGPQK